MSIIEQQVRRVRRRLNLNIFLNRLAVSVAIVAGLWSAAVVADRMLSLEMPLWPSLLIAGGAAIGLAGALTFLHRATALQAAVAIDAAAGLKERVSSALVLEDHDDPFARATVHDAERVAQSVHVPTHMPIDAPRRWPLPIATLIASVILYAFVPNLNLLARSSEESDESVAATAVAERERIEVAIAQQKTRIKQRLENKPQLAGLMEELKQLDVPENPDVKPEDIRRDVVKKVDRVADKIEAQLNDQNLAMLEEMRKQLARLDTPPGDDPASKLAENLAKGDMQGAKAALNDLKKQLEEAQKAMQDDPQAEARLAEMEKKLTDLAEQLEKLASTQRMEKELENKLGLDEETAKKLLEQISKMDPKDIEKALQEAMAQKQNLTEKQKQELKELAEKLMKQQAARQQLKQMAQAMQKAANACKQGQQNGDGRQSAQAAAAGALADAIDQISQLEMTQQMMNELEATLADLRDLKNSTCEGGAWRPDQPRDQQKIGGQGRRAGLGWGAKIGKQPAAHQYESQRVKSQLSSGQIIGQMLIDGPQVRGEANAQVRDAIRSAVRDATDAIEREEVPRQYEKVLRNYFMSLAGLADETAQGGGAAKETKPEAAEK